VKKTDPLAGFTLNGVALQSSDEPAVVRRLKAKLDGLALGQIRDVSWAAKAGGVCRERFLHFSTHPALRPYRIKVPYQWIPGQVEPGPPVLVWGKPKTIQELKRRLGDG